jgi:hypothetical protein
MADGLTKVSAYLASSFERGSTGIYLRGSITMNWFRIPAYLMAGASVNDNSPSYLKGNEEPKSSQSAYVCKMANNTFVRLFGYCCGMIRNTTNVYLEGEPMAQVDYIWLKTSDGGATKSKKFRVIQSDYDDGTLEKAEDLKKTIGGGIDHSVGEVYVTWSMVIRVRHEEPEADYGNKEDIEYFYSLNNPNGTPSNDITFIDHHQVEYTVHTVGKLTKNLLGTQIEGECAWYLYKLQLIRVQ